MNTEKKKQVLIIDDETTHRILAKEYLEEAGYLVRLADDGKRGLQMALSTRPDLVMVDYMIPSLDGVEVCKALKSHEHTTNTPVILVTASREPDIIAHGLSAGVDDFVTKPVDWAFIADRVKHVLVAAEGKRRALAEKLEMARQLKAAKASIDGSHQVAAAAQPSAPTPEGGAPRDVGNLAEELRSLAQSAKADLEALEMRHRAELEAERRVQQARMDALRTSFEKEAALAGEAARAENATHRTEFETALRKAERAADAKIEAIRQESRAEIDQFRQAVQSERHATSAEHARQLQRAHVIADQKIAAEKREWETRCRGLEIEWQSKLHSFYNLALSAGVAHLDAKDEIMQKLRRVGQQVDADAGLLPVKRALLETEKAVNALAASLGSWRMLAQLMSGATKLDETTFDLGQIARDAAARLKPLADVGKVGLRVVTPDPKCLVHGDLARISYGLISLLMNAIRHSPAGATVEIELCENDQADVLVRIKDAGGGIAPAKLARLRNGLLPSARAQAGEPVGFGIAITGTLARLHGGRLNLESNLGHGTTATLHLPISRRRAVEPVGDHGALRAV